MPQLSRRNVLKYCTALPLASALSPFHAATMLDAAEAKTKKPRPQTIKDYSDAKLVDGEPAAIGAGSFTIAVLPDTQKYAANNPEGFLAQTEWIAANRQRRNIAAVLHLGDITDHNREDEWELAVRAMQRLDGQVPYFMALGNHDYSEGGVCADRTTRYNQYFPKKKYEKLPTFGGTYDREPERMENSYHRFAAGGRKFLVLALEFGPRGDVVRWANQVVARHPDHEAILVTHAYMYFDDTRYDWSRYESDQSWNPHSYKVALNGGDDVNDGEQLWKKLVGKNKTFTFTLNGHVLGDGLGRTTTTDAAGRTVNQMLVNFQTRPKGGDGWLRLIELKPGGAVEVCDFSPYRNQHNVSPQNRFQLQTSPLVG